MKKLNLAFIGVLLALTIVSCTNNTETADYQVVPLPKAISLSDKNPFVIDKNTLIVYQNTHEELQKEAIFLADYIEDILGFRLSVRSTDHLLTNAINLIIKEDYFDNNDAYQITVNDNVIKITSSNTSGIFYGIQTLRKSLPVGTKASKITFPAGIITDWPRFAYRGMHLDVSRHFFPIDSVKVYLDVMAMHNLNKFHFHLTVGALRLKNTLNSPKSGLGALAL